jgi:hypothetical protein
VSSRRGGKTPSEAASPAARKTLTRVQQFVIVVTKMPTQRQLDRLVGRRADLSVVSYPEEGYAEVMFDREAPMLIDAILSGIRDLERVGLVASSVRDDDDLVTLATIADRIGKSREAIRLWSIGRLGPGGFPRPVDHNIRTAYYRWSQVAPWLRDRMGIDVPDPEPVVAAINLALQLRAMAPRVSHMDAVRALIAA